MRKLGALLLVCVLAIASIDAGAARMGGGRSFGRQSSNVTQRQATPAPAPTPVPSSPSQSAGNSAAKPTPAAAPTAAPVPPRRPLAGMLGGIAAGLGLAWLAHSLGFGEGFGNLMLVGLLVLAAVVAWRIFSARSRGPVATAPGGFAFQGAGTPAEATVPPQYSPLNVGNDASARPWESHAAAPATGGSLIGSALEGPQTWGIPAGFDADGFLSAAKRNFVALQDAWDRADMPTLRAMMTDGMVGEIRQQLAEREHHIGGQVNKTEVVMLDAKLLGIEELPDVYLASVEFSGMIREDMSAGPSPFREVWNMTRPTGGGSGWLVAGVQALQ